MTFAWYGHLKNLHDRRWYIAALASWGIPFRISPASTAEPNRLHSIKCRATQNHPGGDHVIGFRAVRRGAHEGAFEARLSLGWFMFARSRLLHVSVVDAVPKSRVDTASDE
jgi:hypothetical protein